MQLMFWKPGFVGSTKMKDLDCAVTLNGGKSSQCFGQDDKLASYIIPGIQFPLITGTSIHVQVCLYWLRSNSSGGLERRKT